MTGLRRAAGIGNQFNAVIGCFLFALASGRAMILDAAASVSFNRLTPVAQFKSARMELGLNQLIQSAMFDWSVHRCVSPPPHSVLASYSVLALAQASLKCARASIQQVGGATHRCCGAVSQDGCRWWSCITEQRCVRAQQSILECAALLQLQLCGDLSSLDNTPFVSLTRYAIHHLPVLRPCCGQLGIPARCPPEQAL